MAVNAVGGSYNQIGYSRYYIPSNSGLLFLFEFYILALMSLILTKSLNFREFNRILFIIIFHWILFQPIYFKNQQLFFSNNCDADFI